MHKKMIRLICAMAAIFPGLLTGCLICVFYSCSIASIAGSGIVVTRTRAVPEFDHIHLKEAGRVIINQGDKTAVTIKTDDNILPFIKAIVDGRTLAISSESINLKPTTLEFHLTMPHLRGVSISGSGDIISEGRLETDIFAAVIKGSGDMTLDIMASRMTADIRGSGSFDLTGEVAEFQASIKGSGDIRAHNLVARHATVSIAGSGDCHLSVSDFLRAEISGSGDILYAGHPRVDSHIRGSGSVKNRN